MNRKPDCIFCKIIAKEVPANIIYENDKIVAFYDIDPKAPIHILLVPKEHIATLNDVQDFSIIGEIVEAGVKIAKDLKIANSGYKILANCNRDAGQAVFHIHFHLLGGKKMEYLPV